MSQEPGSPPLSQDSALLLALCESDIIPVPRCQFCDKEFLALDALHKATIRLVYAKIEIGELSNPEEYETHTFADMNCNENFSMWSDDGNDECSCCPGYSYKSNIQIECTFLTGPICTNCTKTKIHPETRCLTDTILKEEIMKRFANYTDLFSSPENYENIMYVEPVLYAGVKKTSH